MTIGERLKLIRQDKALTAKALANILNIPVRTIGGYERGENPPNEKFLTLLIEKLNININWLLTGCGNMYINDVLSDLLENTLGFTKEESIQIEKLFQNDTTRELLLKLIKAKNGDISAIDNLIQTLNGIKVAFM